MNVIVSVNAVTIEEIKRSWKERLFTLPWEPLRKFNIVTKPGCFQIGDNLLVHPVIYEQIKKEIEATKWQFEPRLYMGYGFGNPGIFNIAL